jgi:hypothetical protein
MNNTGKFLHLRFKKNAKQTQRKKDRDEAVWYPSKRASDPGS